MKTSEAASEALRESLVEMGQACLDWAKDTGECHFCLRDGYGPHDAECLVGRYEADALLTTAKE